MLSAWWAMDRLVIRLTQLALAAIGTILLTFLVLAIVGRYMADFPVLFLEAMTRFLFIWFCLLGAGLALREKGHVGFELLRQNLPGRWARRCELLAHGCVLFLLVLLLWGARAALEISASQTDPGLGFSSVWAMSSVPVGVVLMVYHQLCLILERVGIGRTA